MLIEDRLYHAVRPGLSSEAPESTHRPTRKHQGAAGGRSRAARVCGCPRAADSGGAGTGGEGDARLTNSGKDSLMRLFLFALCLLCSCQHAATRVRVHATCWYGAATVEVDYRPVKEDCRGF